MVTAQRVRLGHRTLVGFARSAGLSKTTVDSIESARATSYAPATLAALEDALGWQVGSVERVLKGLEPHLDEDPDLTAVIDAWPRLSPGSRRMLQILATEAARVD